MRSIALVGGISSVVLAAAVYYFLHLPLIPSQQEYLSAPLSRLVTTANFTDNAETGGKSLKKGDIDAVVVLGYACDHERRIPTDPLKRRIEAAAQLVCTLTSDEACNSSFSPSSSTRDRDLIVILTGGLSPQHPPNLATEAEIMYDYLGGLLENQRRAQSLDNGVSSMDKNRDWKVLLPGAVVKLESAAVSTRTNALYSIPILLRQWNQYDADPSSSSSSTRRVILVTNRFHQHRSLETFEKATGHLRHQRGSDVTLDQPPSSEFPSIEWFVLDMQDLDESSVIQFNWWRELAAIVYYKLAGYM